MKFKDRKSLVPYDHAFAKAAGHASYSDLSLPKKRYFAQIPKVGALRIGKERLGNQRVLDITVKRESYGIGIMEGRPVLIKGQSGIRKSITGRASRSGKLLSRNKTVLNKGQVAQFAPNSGYKLRRIAMKTGQHTHTHFDINAYKAGGLILAGAAVGGAFTYKYKTDPKFRNKTKRVAKKVKTTGLKVARITPKVAAGVSVGALLGGYMKKDPKLIKAGALGYSTATLASNAQLDYKELRKGDIYGKYPKTSSPRDIQKAVSGRKASTSISSGIFSAAIDTSPTGVTVSSAHLAFGGYHLANRAALQVGSGRISKKSYREAGKVKPLRRGRKKKTTKSRNNQPFYYRTRNNKRERVKKGRRAKRKGKR